MASRTTTRSPSPASVILRDAKSASGTTKPGSTTLPSSSIKVRIPDRNGSDSDSSISPSTDDGQGYLPPTNDRAYEDPEDKITCMWEDCGQVYTHLPTLIDHIHNYHIGVHKSSYSCEWSGCGRKGLPQTSRFALISHIRSHTGEKPFTCPRPECDKSFTRSDALAKHMRLQHNISPPAPGRGGSRKRKRDDPIVLMMTGIPPSSGGNADSTTTSPTNGAGSAFTTFKVEPTRQPGESLAGGGGSGAATGTGTDEEGEFLLHINGYKHSGSAPSGEGMETNMEPAASALHSTDRFPSLLYRTGGTVAGHPPPPGILGRGMSDREELEDSADLLPPYLMEHYDPKTRRIRGRTPENCLYLLMKARYRHAHQQSQQLQQELDELRSEAEKIYKEKEETVDAVLRGLFGAESDKFIRFPSATGGVEQEVRSDQVNAKKAFFVPTC